MPQNGHLKPQRCHRRAAAAMLYYLTMFQSKEINLLSWEWKLEWKISSSRQIEINFGNLLLMLLALHYIIKINFWQHRIGRIGIISARLYFSYRRHYLHSLLFAKKYYKIIFLMEEFLNNMTDFCYSVRKIRGISISYPIFMDQCVSVAWCFLRMDIRIAEGYTCKWMIWIWGPFCPC